MLEHRFSLTVKNLDFFNDLLQIMRDYHNPVETPIVGSYSLYKYNVREGEIEFESFNFCKESNKVTLRSQSKSYLEFLAMRFTIPYDLNAVKKISE